MFKEISDFYQPISMLGRGGSSKVHNLFSVLGIFGDQKRLKRLICFEVCW